MDVISVTLRMWLLLDEEHVGSEEMTDFGQAPMGPSRVPVPSAAACNMAPL